MDLDCPAVAVGVLGDSARYFTRDQLYLLLFNVISGKNHKRYWVGAWSKRTQCDCGCKGRCTLDGIMAVFVWSIGCLVRGKFPWVRHDNVPFAESDRVGDRKRAMKVGSNIFWQRKFGIARGLEPTPPPHSNLLGLGRGVGG